MNLDISRVNILGVGVSAINMDMALSVIDHWIQNGLTEYVCVRDVHGIVESFRDDNIRKIHSRAGLVTPDGMPLVWISRMQGFKSVDRVYGPDLMLALCEHSVSKGYRHFFYGGAEGVPELLVSSLTRRYPELIVVGAYSPPFRSLSEDEKKDVVQMINSAEPDIVWVGLSTPKQEQWMAEFSERLDSCILIGVGAAFDFHAGLKKQAPSWIQRSGLEWLFRLATEPKRLWKRYLINNPLFIALIVSQFLGLKKYDID